MGTALEKPKVVRELDLPKARRNINDYLWELLSVEERDRIRKRKKKNEDDLR